MRRDGKTQIAWRRQARNPNTDPDQILRELQSRELSTLDVCERVWEEAGDPLAVCEAVRQSGLPEWLESAVLVLLTDGEAGYPSYRQRLWRDRTRHAIDRARAEAIASFRTNRYQPQTWETALSVSNVAVRQRWDDVPSLSASGSKRSYERVCRGVSYRSRYFVGKPGLALIIARAWKEFLPVMRSLVSPK